MLIAPVKNRDIANVVFIGKSRQVHTVLYHSVPSSLANRQICCREAISTVNYLQSRYYLDNVSLFLINLSVEIVLFY